MVKRMEIHVKEKGATRAARGIRKVDEAQERVVRSTIRASKAQRRMRVNTDGLRRSLGVLRNNLLLVTFAFGGMTVIIGKAIKAAGDAVEVMSKFRAVFKAQASEAEQWAMVFGEAVGRAKIDIIDWASTLQDTFVPLGFARDKAAELSKTLVELAVDAASFSNKLDADVIRDFQSAIVGNHETVRKYGIVITEATLKQDAMKKVLTDQEKVQSRINLLIKGTSDAQGDAVRTAESYNNQLKRSAAVTKEMAIALGQLFKPAAKEAVGLWRMMAEEAKNFFEAIAPSNQNRIDELSDRIIELQRRQAKGQLGVGLRAKAIAKYQKELWDLVKAEMEAAFALEGFTTIHERFTASFILGTSAVTASLERLDTAFEKWAGSSMKVQMQMLATELRIRKMREALDDSTTSTNEQIAKLQGLAQVLGPLSILLNLAGIAKLGTGIGTISTGLGAVTSLLSMIPKAGAGADFITSKPQIIMVGDKGTERVQITPQQAPSPAPSGNVYHIHLHAPVPEDYIRNELLPVLGRVQSTG